MKGILIGVLLSILFSLSLTLTICWERGALLTWALFILFIFLANSEEEVFE